MRHQQRFWRVPDHHGRLALAQEKLHSGEHIINVYLFTSVTLVQYSETVSWVCAMMAPGVAFGDGAASMTRIVANVPPVMQPCIPHRDSGSATGVNTSSKPLALIMAIFSIGRPPTNGFWSCWIHVPSSRGSNWEVSSEPLPNGRILSNWNAN